MSSLKTPVCAQEYIASKGVSRCIFFCLFQGSSACAWWIWTVQPQQKNTATLFKWYLWSQRAALPKITWSWVSPCRMRHSLLMFCHWLPDESPGHAGSSRCLIWSSIDHLEPVLTCRKSWKKDTYCVCRRAAWRESPEASAAKRITLTGQVSISRTISLHVYLIVSVGYSN